MARKILRTIIERFAAQEALWQRYVDVQAPWLDRKPRRTARPAG